MYAIGPQGYVEPTPQKVPSPVLNTICSFLHLHILWSLIATSRETRICGISIGCYTPPTISQRTMAKRFRTACCLDFAKLIGQSFGYGQVLCVCVCGPSNRTLSTFHRNLFSSPLYVRHWRQTEMRMCFETTQPGRAVSSTACMVRGGGGGGMTYKR